MPALDALRGIAIVLVLVGHATLPRLPGLVLGVDLFFCLSGFLITALLLGEWQRDETISFRGFYRRRALRLLPALVVLLLVFVAVLRSGAMLEVAAVVLLYVSNFAVMGGEGLGVAYFGHTWSLAQEEQFYLLWPFLLALLLRHRMSSRALMTGLVALFVGLCLYRFALVSSGTSPWRLWYGPDTHADGLVLGSLAAVAYSSGALRRVRTWMLIPACVVAVASILALDPERAWNLSVVVPLFSLAATVVLASLVLEPESALRRTIDQRPLRYFGRVSYGLYLWHLPLYVLLGWKLGLPLSLAAAALSYRYIEQPFLRRRHRGLFDRGRGSASSTAAAQAPAVA